MRRRRARETTIHGTTAPGFEGVADAFRENFTDRGDVGAACAVYHRGRKVADLWGGYRDGRRALPWEQDTMVLVFSTTKGMASIAMAVAHARGLLDWDEPIATYWPEFAANGKDRITVRQLMSHQAGLAVVKEKLDTQILADPDRLARILARQKPLWKPGTLRGYHSITIGWYESEILRRVDPRHRRLGEFFRDEVARPLDLEFFIGLPPEVPESRVAVIEGFHPLRIPLNVYKISPRMAMAAMLPWSLLNRSFNPKLANPADMSSPEYRALEIPAANGIGEARAIARAYSALAEGGGELGIGPETLEALMTPVPPSTPGGVDKVLKLDLRFSTGFVTPSKVQPFGSSPRAFGMAGLGGSFGFADPDERLGYAYVTNKMDLYFFNDPREKALREACYRSLAQFEGTIPGPR